MFVVVLKYFCTCVRLYVCMLVLLYVSNDSCVVVYVCMFVRVYVFAFVCLCDQCMLCYEFMREVVKQNYF